MLTSDEIIEINLLSQFNLANSLEGLKIHSHDADPAIVAAAERLFAKGLITQHVGGYLTSLGLDAADVIRRDGAEELLLGGYAACSTLAHPGSPTPAPRNPRSTAPDSVLFCRRGPRRYL